MQMVKPTRQLLTTLGCPGAKRAGQRPGHTWLRLSGPSSREGVTRPRENCSARLLGFAICAWPLSEQRTLTLTVLQRSRFAGAAAQAGSVQGLGMTTEEKLCACILPARVQSNSVVTHQAR